MSSVRSLLCASLGVLWLCTTALAGEPLVILVHGVGGGNRPEGWSSEIAEAYGVDDPIEISFRYAGRDGPTSFVDFRATAGDWSLQVRDQLQQALDRHPGRPAIVISHSWGSVATAIALGGGAGAGSDPRLEADDYNIAPLQVPRGRIREWVTIGSPLGGAPLLQRGAAGAQLSTAAGVAYTLERPASVRHWTNIFDRDDPVSEASRRLPHADNFEVRDSGSRFDPTGVTHHTGIWTNPFVIRHVTDLYDLAELESDIEDEFTRPKPDLAFDSRPGRIRSDVDPRPQAQPPPEQDFGKPDTWGGLDEQLGREPRDKDPAPQAPEQGEEPEQAPPQSWDEALEQIEDVEDAGEPANGTGPGTLQPDDRIVLFGYELASGAADDRSGPALLDPEHVVIVVERADGSTEILDRRDALPVLRARGFLQPGSLALTDKGRLGYDTADRRAVDEPTAEAPRPDEVIVWLRRRVLVDPAQRRSELTDRDEWSSNKQQVETVETTTVTRTETTFAAHEAGTETTVYKWEDDRTATSTWSSSFEVRWAAPPEALAEGDRVSMRFDFEQSAETTCAVWWTIGGFVKAGYADGADLSNSPGDGDRISLANDAADDPQTNSVVLPALPAGRPGDRLALYVYANDARGSYQPVSGPVVAWIYEAEAMSRDQHRELIARLRPWPGPGPQPASWTRYDHPDAQGAGGRK